MPLFPHIPLFESVCARWGADVGFLKDVRLVCVQHLLETTGSLFERLIALGASPANVFVIGKPYSTNTGVAERLKCLGINVLDNAPVKRWGALGDQLRSDVGRLWDRALRDISPRTPVIVLDDGGYAIGESPVISPAVFIAGVEQTMSGIGVEPSRFPVVEVASSAAKKYLEATLIEAAVLRRLDHHYRCSEPNLWGIVGLGNIGRAIARRLLSEGHQVFGYDEDPIQMNSLPPKAHCGSVRQVFERAEWIFGCTGSDILAGVSWWTGLRGQRVLVSCSSSDIEFRTLLRSVAAPPPDPHALSDIDVPTEKGSLRILRGGCPINFDGSPESVPSNDIRLTRALLLGGILQAASIARQNQRGYPSRVMLSPRLQTAIAREWLHVNGARDRYDARVIEIVESAPLTAMHSGGEDVAPMRRVRNAGRLQSQPF